MRGGTGGGFEVPVASDLSPSDDNQNVVRSVLECGCKAASTRPPGDTRKGLPGVSEKLLLPKTSDPYIGMTTTRPLLVWAGAGVSPCFGLSRAIIGRDHNTKTYALPSYLVSSSAMTGVRRSDAPPELNVTPRKRNDRRAMFHEVTETNQQGVSRNIIVIDDTPPPKTPLASRIRVQTRRTNTGGTQLQRGRGKPSKLKGTGLPTLPAKRYHHPPLCDDKEGHYIIVPGDVIPTQDIIRRCEFFCTSHHVAPLDPLRPDRIIKQLGSGTYGRVAEGIDSESHRNVAIKIIRARQQYRVAAMMELQILQLLKRRDPSNSRWVGSTFGLIALIVMFTSKCIQLLHHFQHIDHVCLVFEVLGKSIYEFIWVNNFSPFPRLHIQSFTHQLLESLACTCIQSSLARRHSFHCISPVLREVHVIHTDLKPENILLVRDTCSVQKVLLPGEVWPLIRLVCCISDPLNVQGPPRETMVLKSTEIRLVDFGCAVIHSKRRPLDVISTTYYRAPEVILGMHPSHH